MCVCVCVCGAGGDGRARAHNERGGGRARARGARGGGPAGGAGKAHFQAAEIALFAVCLLLMKCAGQEGSAHNPNSQLNVFVDLQYWPNTNKPKTLKTLK